MDQCMLKTLALRSHPRSTEAASAFKQDLQVSIKSLDVTYLVLMDYHHLAS